MKYCRRCILPDTRPHLFLHDDGICNACHTHDLRDRIDWKERESAFRSVVENAKRRVATRGSTGYDCLIPVSGGKDSTWQVVTCLEYGLKPLTVTWAPPSRTEIGRKNLENLISLGVDHIDYRIAPDVERKFMRQALHRFGSPAIPMHMALFQIPLKIAIMMRIPLVVWGENSAFEYGGSGEERLGFRLNSNWLRKHGVTHGTTAVEWIGAELTEKELTPYFGPAEEELEEAGLLAVFLGYYFAWDPQHTFEVARQHGFRARAEGPITGHYDFADIDDDFISVHHYLKWPKFGILREFDNLSIEIRNGRLTRGEALDILARNTSGAPRKDTERLCSYLGMEISEFREIHERYRNPDIWSKDAGVWKLKDFILPEWNWAAYEI